MDYPQKSPSASMPSSSFFNLHKLHACLGVLSLVFLYGFIDICLINSSYVLSFTYESPKICQNVIAVSLYTSVECYRRLLRSWHWWIVSDYSFLLSTGTHRHPYSSFYLPNCSWALINKKKKKTVKPLTCILGFHSRCLVSLFLLYIPAFKAETFSDNHTLILARNETFLNHKKTYASAISGLSLDRKPICPLNVSAFTETNRLYLH